MKLYKVTCFSEGYSECDNIDIYVMANDPVEAREKAINKMKYLKLRYIDGTSKIQRIADSKFNSGVELLVTD